MMTTVFEPILQAVMQRPYCMETDYQPVRELLTQTLPITPTGWNWDLRRWDGTHWHRDDASIAARDWSQFGVWETADGQIVGVAHSEYWGSDLHLQLHPDYRHLEAEMIAWAEVHVASKTGPDGEPEINMVVKDYDCRRQHILQARGWTMTAGWEVSRRMRLSNWPPAETNLHAGYSVYNPDPNSMDDCQRIADLLNAAFRRSIHSAQEVHNFLTNSPSYRPEFDLFALAPDGTFAATAGVTFDPQNRSGLFEPVCTHPDHQRKGLASALIREGLRRLRVNGALDAYVDTGDMDPANSLYDSVGFLEVYKGHWWHKSL